MIEGTAACGVRYAVKRRQGAVAYTSLSIQAGTRDEGGFHGGIAHFTEHTLFRGTSRKSASVISSYLDRLGGELNAYTTKEEIVLHATVLREDILKAEKLLLELALEATFPEKEIATEKGVVIDEIISSKDSPADDIYDRFEQEIFGSHPLGGLILGTRASVSKISSDELRRFVAEKFTPGKMAFTVVADIPEEKMALSVLSLLDKTFGPGRHVPVIGGDRAGGTPSFRKFDMTLERRGHEVNAVIGAPAPSLYGGKERFAAILLCNILGGPASNSLLGGYLRERNGWVYGIECSYTQFSDSGLAAISFGCDRPNLDKCIAAVDRILDGVRSKAFSERRLKAAAKQLLCQAAISSESGESACLSMGKSLLAFGHVITPEETRRAVGSLTPEDIQDSACAIFGTENISRLVFL